MNMNETGFRVFDGVWADVAGAGRGSFNHRFAQPSRSTFAYSNAFYPADLFPFSDVPQPRPGGDGRTEGLLDGVSTWTMPKIIYTDGSWEYWNRVAALLHSSSDGMMDAPLGPRTRLYVLSGAQHGSGDLPKRDAAARYPLNPVDTRPYYRAMLVILHEWVKDNREPPRSQYPLLAEGQLVPVKAVRWPAWTGAALPQHPNSAHELDFGPEFESHGIISKEPPVDRGAYPALVPQVDADGIDQGGIRLPEVAVPLGVPTGWNLRVPAAGAAGELTGTHGSFFAFPKARILERYGDKDGYLKRIGEAADALVKRRFLLVQDREHVLKHAAALWDFAADDAER
jgi:hypothetical protein